MAHVQLPRVLSQLYFPVSGCLLPVSMNRELNGGGARFCFAPTIKIFEGTLPKKIQAG